MARTSTSTQSDGSVRAILELPEAAIRVVAAPPDTITQRNVEAVTGLSSRVYLEVIRGAAFPVPVAKLGKLRIVNRAAFVEWLEKQGVDSTDSCSDSDVESRNSLASILDEVGLEHQRELPRRRNGLGRRTR